MNVGPTSLLPRLSWLWIGSLLGGLAGLALAILCIVLLRALPIPGLQAWIFGSTTWIGIGLLLLGWLTSLGILLTQCTLGLMFWTRGKKEEDPASGLAGTLGFSAATALASSALFLIAWKSIPHAPFLAMIWPPVAVGLQLSLLGAGTPWLLLLASLLRRLPSRQQQFGQLLHTLIEQVRATVRTQLPRFLIALHATGISFALWLSPLLQTSDFRKTHHILISLLQAVVLLILTLGHLWLARSALLASLRNGLAQHISVPMSKIANRLPVPPAEILLLFRPPATLTPWLRLPWSLAARRFSTVIDRWDEWTQATNPAERLREFLSTEVPGYTGPILLAGLQILTALLPLFLWT